MVDEDKFLDMGSGRALTDRPSRCQEAENEGIAVGPAVYYVSFLSIQYRLPEFMLTVSEISKSKGGAIL